MCLLELWFAQVVGFLGHMMVLICFLKKSSYCSPQWLYQLTFPPRLQEHSFFSASSPAFIVCTFFGDVNSDSNKMILNFSFDLHLSSNEQ